MTDDPVVRTYEVRGVARFGPLWGAWLLTFSGAANTLSALDTGGWRLFFAATTLACALLLHVVARLTGYQRVVVDECGVTLVAPWRQVRIRLDQLRAVSPTRPGPVTALRWERHEGRRLQTPAVDDVDGLLDEVRRRAPDTEVGALRPLRPFWG